MVMVNGQTATVATEFLRTPFTTNQHTQTHNGQLCPLNTFLIWYDEHNKKILIVIHDAIFQKLSTKVGIIAAQINQPKTVTLC